MLGVNLLNAAKSVEKYLSNFEVVSDNNGLYWDISHSFEGEWRYYDNISLYAGSSGIIKFLVELYEVTGDEKYLNKAILAGKHIVFRYNSSDKLDKSFSKFAITTGLGGVAFSLNLLYDLTNDKIFFGTVQSILNKVVEEFNDEGYWSQQIGIVADAGTALILLEYGEKYNINGWETILESFGDYILENRQIDSQGKKFYVGLDLDFVGGPTGKFNTGFPLGPAGVAFTLLKIWEVTGEERFFEGTKGIEEFYQFYSVDEGSILLPHYLPGEEHICYVGYCGGPVGVARYFYEYYRLTGDDRYLNLFKQSIAGLDVVHAPLQRSEGFWEVDNYCCGTAGILELFLGAYIVTEDDKYLDKAKLTGELLLNRIHSSNKGSYWVQAFERKHPENETVGLGYYDGISGIATSLLHLYEILEGNFKTVRFVDDPYPAEFGGNHG